MTSIDSPVLSAGAMTYCYEKAREFVYGYKPELSSREIEKGLLVEDQAIELYNAVNFCSAIKNEVRLSDELFTGEADFFLSDRGVDIKCAWSFSSFHATKDRLFEASKKAGYDWQCAVYMMLYDVDRWDIANCLMNTPEHLIGYESEDLHVFDHLDDTLRITTISYERNAELEKKMRVKASAAKAQIEQFIEQITLDHQ
jgi:hypothetical protein